MPTLIRYIEGNFFPSTTTTAPLVKTISGEIQFEDFIDLNGYIAFLQNFTKTPNTVLLQKPLLLGLNSLAQPNNNGVNIGNNTMITLEITY